MSQGVEEHPPHPIHFCADVLARPTVRRHGWEHGDVEYAGRDEYAVCRHEFSRIADNHRDHGDSGLHGDVEGTLLEGTQTRCR